MDFDKSDFHQVQFLENWAAVGFSLTINFNRPIYIKFKMKKDSALGR